MSLMLRGTMTCVMAVAGSCVVAHVVDAQAAHPQTRAEATQFTETSHYTDVVAFLDTLRARGAPITITSLGTSTDKRSIPVVIASRPKIATPEEARASRRPIVYLNANIHVGEVEGKEAVLALLRDLSADAKPNVLDSLVIIVVPDYNADGNDRFAAQAVNRDEQNGPEQVGTRANAMGLDLNRDYVKTTAPETRGALTLFNAWTPDVYVDLHTTDGSYHGYALTYSPSLSPAAPLGTYTHAMLAELRKRLRTRSHVETFDYGNFDTDDGEADITDSVKHAWYTYDYRPRFGTNYYGIRGGIAILSEAFSHDPFDRRVASTRAFVQSILSLTAERAKEIRHVVNDARNGRPQTIPLGGVVTTKPRHETVLVERLIRTGDSTLTQPGVPRGVRRTGVISAQMMPVYDRFDAKRAVTRPAGYIIPATEVTAISLLKLHGIEMRAMRAGERIASTQTYTVDSMVHAARKFQGHFETRLTGTWNASDTVDWDSTFFYVTTDQPLGTLAVYLLEPESADGFATWNIFDTTIQTTGEYPVLRVAGRGRR